METFFTRRKSYSNCLQSVIFVETNGSTSNNQLIIVRNLEMQIRNVHVLKCSFSSLFTDLQQFQYWWYSVSPSWLQKILFKFTPLIRELSVFIHFSSLHAVIQKECNKIAVLRRKFWICYRNEIKYFHSVLYFTVDIGLNM